MSFVELEKPAWAFQGPTELQVQTEEVHLGFGGFQKRIAEIRPRPAERGTSCALRQP
jgi:hypothetical protein